MARWYGLYIKKRGLRRTGSPAAARWGDAAFAGSVTLLGLIGIGLVLSWWIVPQWEANYNYVESTCRVLDKRVDFAADGIQARPEFLVEHAGDGRVFRSWTYDAVGDYQASADECADVLDRFQVGEQYACWHSETDPTRVVLARNISYWPWLVLAVPASLLLIGAGRLGYNLASWRTSAERRAALIQRASQFDVFDESLQGGHDVPGVPSAGNWTNSPGTRLAYRLPLASSTGWKLFGCASFAALWWIATLVLTAVAVRKHVAGEADWLLDILLLPAFGGGAWAIYYVARQWWLTTGLGPTLVEISDHPLVAGQSYDLVVLQSGRLTIPWLEVRLCCDEVASYTQGTDIRTERQRVYDTCVMRCTDLEVTPQGALERRCRMTIPAEAMHSFQGGHNEVQWSILVCGELAGWPVFHRRFPLVVYPPSAEKDVA
ncbi:MAG: hypothetical protein WD176_06445 [Pirellulales bacterium]